MDMAAANLLKHKIRFEKYVEDDSDWSEPLIPNKGYHYASTWIENGESIGIRNVSDLFIDKLKPMFLHIISTMYHHEAEMEIDSIMITVGVFDKESDNDYDIVKYTFSSTPDDAITNYDRSWVYSFPESILDGGFSIYIQSYVYMVDDYVRQINGYYEEMNMEREMEHEMGENRQEENKEIKPLPPPLETYKEDICVVCLEAKPNILYLDCMHIAICDSCERVKSKTSSQSTCDVCRAEISKRIKI